MIVLLSAIVEDTVLLFRELGVGVGVLFGIGIGLWYGIPAVWALVVRSVEKRMAWMDVQIELTSATIATNQQVARSVEEGVHALRSIARLIDHLRSKDMSVRPVLLVVEDNVVEAVRTAQHARIATKGQNLVVASVQSLGDAFLHLSLAAGIVLDIGLDDAPLPVVQIFVDMALSEGRWVIVYSWSDESAAAIKGATAFVSKSAHHQELIEAIQEAAATPAA